MENIKKEFNESKRLFLFSITTIMSGDCKTKYIANIRKEDAENALDSLYALAWLSQDVKAIELADELYKSYSSSIRGRIDIIIDNLAE